MSVDSSAMAPSAHRLADYKPTAYSITKIELEIDLDEANTYVKSKLYIKARDGVDPATTPLILQGVDLDLLEVKMDQLLLNPSQYTKTDTSLLLSAPSRTFCVETKCLIHPSKNLALEGLYQSGEILCTQCEAEGFRRITYFLDRPDIMAIWQVTLRADSKKFPLLLSNGNKQSSQQLPNGKHEIVWYDPWPKPCYLFAIAAGDLFCIEDKHISSLSGRSFDLKIYCEHHNSHRLQFAMQSLKRSMLWDETCYGREYDLDVFHIVAVDSFNMGAMENKGLNIFNAQCLLADTNSTTDDEFRRIEAIIAHEYFHNWSGNRITCRDWFQLTLKEGLTVFRDHQFSGDHHSAGVVRLEQVQALVLRQMVEDASALAHPIQPNAYEDINNFYTLTVYEKGAEVIRMLHTLFGALNYRKALDYYFEHFDGMAATTEDFIHSFEVVLGKDLKAFRRWYSHYRTPRVEFSRSGEKLVLKLNQSATMSHSSTVEPLVIPLKTAFFDAKTGQKLLETLIILDEWEKELEFDLPSNSLVSINRELSAPVLIQGDHSATENQKLACFDDDPVSRWMLSRAILSYISQEKNPDFSPWIRIVESCFNQETLDAHTKALLTLAPSTDQWLELVEGYDIDRALFLHKELLLQTSKTLKPLFSKVYNELNSLSLPKDSPQMAANRHLKAVCLDYLIWSDPSAFELLWNQLETADNMSDRFSSFRLLCRLDNPYKEKAIEHYRRLHHGDNLTWPKWIAAQSSSLANDTLERVQNIARDPTSCNKTVPNQIRALVANFTNNPGFFHAKDGSGYAWVMQILGEIDSFNPQTAAKLAKAFAIAPRLPQSYKTLITRYIKEALAKPLSISLKEVLEQSLNKVKE